MSMSPLLSLFLLLLLNAVNADAQPSPSSYNKDGTAGPYSTNLNAATAVLIVVLISAFLFLAFFSVYFHRCCNRNSSSVTPAAPSAVTTSRRGARRGLDPAILEAIPTLSYSEATKLKIGTESLECAVCLSEFTDEQMLRMLPKCCHVFHTECIDTWLESHVTCPVCRANLALVDSTEGVAPCEEEEEEEEEGHAEGEVVIDIGHVGGGDRYTLRLPEHVRREIVAAGSLRRSASVAVFRSGGEGSMKRGYRRGRSLGVGHGLSERWTAGILARVSTWRRGEVAAEVSVKRGESSSGDVGN